MSDNSTSSKTYSYELYRFDRDDLGGHITLTASPEAVSVEDYSIGSTTEAFFGSDEHEYIVSVNKAEAILVLQANGIAPGHYPTEKLGLWFAERYTGDSKAASKFVELAKEAGVTTEVDIW